MFLCFDAANIVQQLGAAVVAKDGTTLNQRTVNQALKPCKNYILENTVRRLFPGEGFIMLLKIIVDQWI
jgi:hypothetical protein